MPQHVADTPFFRGIRQRELAIRQHRGKSPMFFAAARVMGAVFTIDAAAARALLPRPDWRPVTVFPGTALLGVAAFDYGYTDIGPYREVFAAIPITTGRARLPQPIRLARDFVAGGLVAHTIQLPVDSEAALFGGLDYYNVPKYMAHIEYEKVGADARCMVTDELDDELVFELQLPRPRSLKGGGLEFLARQSFRNLSLLNGRTVIAKFDLRLRENLIVGPPDVRLRMGTGARAAMLTGLRPGRALFAFFGDKGEAILHEPQFLE